MNHLLVVFMLSVPCWSLHVHHHDEDRIEVPTCPAGGTAMLNANGQPRRCLPHQTNICIRALPQFDPSQEAPPDPNAVCCWYNQVDYFCCSNVDRSVCPDYKNITVVIHKGVPQQHGPRLLAFRKVIRRQPRLQGPILPGASGAFPPGFQPSAFGSLSPLSHLPSSLQGPSAVATGFPGFEVPTSFPGFETSNSFAGFPLPQVSPIEPRVLSRRIISSFDPSFLNPDRSQRRLVLSAPQRVRLAARRRALRSRQI